MANPIPGIWRGTQNLTQGPDEWEITASKMTVKTYWEGPWTDIEAQPMQIGQGVTGYNFGLLVTSFQPVNLGQGGKGRLTVILEAVQDPSAYNSDALGASIYEVEWQELTRPIEAHPRCGILDPARTTNNDLSKILSWEDWQYLSPSGGDGAGDYLAQSNGSVNQGDTWTLEEYMSLKAQGVDSYNVAAPIIRRTTEHLYPPSDLGSGVDKIQDPPTAANFGGASDFQWLGGPDRCTKSHRTFQRQTEWVGATLWSPLLYQSG